MSSTRGQGNPIAEAIARIRTINNWDTDEEIKRKAIALIKDRRPRAGKIPEFMRALGAEIKKIEIRHKPGTLAHIGASETRRFCAGEVAAVGHAYDPIINKETIQPVFCTDCEATFTGPDAADAWGKHNREEHEG